ncbi:23S rRNA (pseudouridine(1915)-N(3))-methyltransferase RlmH [Brucella abortus]|nr:23S rRNA (pseudouridine(1915)-N(3))-methyltransferase RlmH [Brucella abortus]
MRRFLTKCQVRWDQFRGAALILLDERGKTLGSEALRPLSDVCATTASASLSLPCGGPDGHDPALRSRADLVLALGEPHLAAPDCPYPDCRTALTAPPPFWRGSPYHRS